MTITIPQALAALRALLGEFYGNLEDIGIMVKDAGLDHTTIDMDGSVDQVWDAVLVAAHHHKKIEAIIDLAIAQYTAQAERLESARAQYLAARAQDTRQSPLLQRFSTIPAQVWVAIIGAVGLTLAAFIQIIPPLLIFIAGTATSIPPTTTPTATPTVVPTYTPEPTATPTMTPTATATDTLTPTPVPTDTPTATSTTTATDTLTPTPVPTDTPIPTPTNTATATETAAPTFPPTPTDPCLGVVDRPCLFVDRQSWNGIILTISVVVTPTNGWLVIYHGREADLTDTPVVKQLVRAGSTLPVKREIILKPESEWTPDERIVREAIQQAVNSGNGCATLWARLFYDRESPGVFDPGGARKDRPWVDDLQTVQHPFLVCQEHER